jgi:hypothetical protein
MFGDRRHAFDHNGPGAPQSYLQFNLAAPPVPGGDGLEEDRWRMLKTGSRSRGSGGRIQDIG